jgi:hypothetical protein
MDLVRCNPADTLPNQNSSLLTRANHENLYRPLSRTPMNSRRRSILLDSNAVNSEKTGAIP